MVAVTAALCGLAARAVSAARRARGADPDGFAERHLDWHTWQRRARLGRALATVLGVPVEQVSVIDDPHRVYGAVPGDLLIITDTDTDTDGDSERRWRFVPDLGAAETFLLLDECPDCGATVPITRVAALADLGAYLDADDPGYDPAQGCPDEFPDDPAHRPECGSHPDRPPSRHGDGQARAAGIPTARASRSARPLVAVAVDGGSGW